MALLILRTIFIVVSAGIAVLIINASPLEAAPSWVPWGILAGKEPPPTARR